MPADTNLSAAACVAGSENSSCQNPRGFIFSRSFSSNRGRTPLISRSARWLLAVLGIGLSTLLVTAVFLRPSSQGFGTHQQLGLPPCTFVMLYGRRCPACGMTTSWSRLVRGQLPSALRANVGGTLLGMIVMMLAPWCLVCALRGTWWIIRPSDFLIISLVVIVSVVTIGDWAVRLAVP